MEQMSIFDLMDIDKVNIDKNKKVRIIEFFGGYGSQSLALKLLGIPFEHYKLCEWAFQSIIAYADLHRNELPYYGQNFCGDLTKEQIAQELVNYGVSLDYDKPATFEQLKRKDEADLRLCYNSIWWGNNLVDIMRTKGKDLVIVDKEHFTYLLTYSYPCQDLSKAGLQKGQKKGSGTRSALLWEVDRILTECKEYNNQLPDILLMENVPDAIEKRNAAEFREWYHKLETLGYSNFCEILNAKNYGIPQNRRRVFMVSILNSNVHYKFPKSVKRKLVLHDLLETNVDDKYLLNEKQIENIKKWNAQEKPLERMEITERERVAPTLTTRTGDYDASMILIKNKTKKGYLEAELGDGVDISSRMEHHRGTVQKGMAQTLTTMGGGQHRCSDKEEYP